jgi:hypothetical protein
MQLKYFPILQFAFSSSTGINRTKSRVGLLICFNVKQIPEGGKSDEKPLRESEDPALD